MTHKDVIAEIPTTSEKSSVAKPKAERTVYLALSQKAAVLLEGIMADAGVTRPPSEQDIIKAIHRDLHEQIEKPERRGGKLKKGKK